MWKRTKTNSTPDTPMKPYAMIPLTHRAQPGWRRHAVFGLLLLACAMAAQWAAAAVTIYSDDFEAYSNVATIPLGEPTRPACK
jgi:hypothetical protein